MLRKLCMKLCACWARIFLAKIKHPFHLFGRMHFIPVGRDRIVHANNACRRSYNNAKRRNIFEHNAIRRNDTPTAYGQISSDHNMNSQPAIFFNHQWADFGHRLLQNRSSNILISMIRIRYVNIGSKHAVVANGHRACRGNHGSATHQHFFADGDRRCMWCAFTSVQPRIVSNTGARTNGDGTRANGLYTSTKGNPRKALLQKGIGGGAGLIHFTHEQILFAVCAVQWFARWLAHPALSRGNLGEIAYESRDKFQDR